MGRPSNGCQETREFSQTCTEAELPKGELKVIQRWILILDDCRNQRAGGATTTMSCGTELLEDEVTDNAHGAGGSLICSEEVHTQNPTVPLNQR